ncbi:hypothetical protein N324_10711, partial [Chlamydotis macqueenii]
LMAQKVLLSLVTRPSGDKRGLRERFGEVQRGEVRRGSERRGSERFGEERRGEERSG